MQDLGTLGGPNSSAQAINTSGEVVGVADVAPGISHAFLWYDGLMQDLGTLGGGQSEAQAINRNGLIAGEAQTASGDWHAFLWDRGIMLDLGTLPGDVNSYALGINNNGHIAGASYAADGSSQAILWENGVMQGLGTIHGYPNSSASAINSADEIVGYGTTADFSATEALLWFDGSVLGLGRSIGLDSMANGINFEGQIVGEADTASNVMFGYEWTIGFVTNLGDAPGIGPDVVDTHANWIDHEGDIVGFDDLTDGNSDAALWSGGVFQDIGTLGGSISSGFGVVHAITPVTAPPPSLPIQLLPAQVSVTLSSLTPGSHGQTQSGTVTLTNIGSTSVSGPLQLIFATLPEGVGLAQETGDLDGIPYLIVPQPDGLESGQSITVPVTFQDPFHAAINCTLELYSGSVQ
jgi:probable HAF family extracellular repeat protein